MLQTYFNSFMPPDSHQYTCDNYINDKTIDVPGSDIPYTSQILSFKGHEGSKFRNYNELMSDFCGVHQSSVT